MFIISDNLFSQDYIRINTGDTLRCKISEINPHYLKFKNQEVVRVLSTDSILGYKIEDMDYVTLYDGKIDKFTKSRKPNIKYNFAISPGIGISHGIGGIKILIGPYGNSGIFGSVGFGELSPYWRFGLQINANWFYLSSSIGPVAFYQTGYFNSETNTINGLTVEAGGIINLEKSRRFFIQLGAGYNIPFEKIIIFYGPLYLVDFTGLRPEICIGVKF